MTIDDRVLDTATPVRWAHLGHPADIGVRGCGPTREAAFEQAALALTAVITPVDPGRLRASAWGGPVPATAPRRALSARPQGVGTFSEISRSIRREMLARIAPSLARRSLSMPRKASLTVAVWGVAIVSS